ncbi:LarC family nickel insertion protein [Bacillus sp. T33-2]|uniref:LarC family nickel insertion protein n=1 Tax=Bacillus sp. T33-2 TaxID=2054168 RepID=UPI000C766FBD|nr:LarC family nickel insertion protein [Bacillus sp. T33-2]PLR94670.1 hypothetical protein CVD19_17055 [Bacillus sp. T33-2]
MKILYLDCFSGISGDMTVGALSDLGVNQELIIAGIKKLKLENEVELAWKKVNKKGITATKFDVIIKEHHTTKNHHETKHVHSQNDNHSHSHGHSHDHSHDQSHGHSHDHSHGHSHDHSHDQSHGHSHDHTHSDSHGHSHDHNHNHSHGHSHYSQIVRLIESSELNDRVKEISISIFTKIGEAEAKIHGIPLSKVHFHEVGAVDSIVDIVGTAIAIDSLNIDKVVCSQIPVGNGKIMIDHGLYPVPAPATLDILKGIPLAKSDINGELTTPTGAGIAATLAQEFGPIPGMIVEEIGYGAGTKDFDNHPNVLRVLIGEL